MIIMIIAVLVTLYCLNLLSGGFIKIGASGCGKAFSAYYVLFIPYLTAVQALNEKFYQNIVIVSSGIDSILNFFCSSNHLVILSDILFFLSALILVLFNNIKIAKPHPAR